jgi:putative tryptophan/tyrosine transport system substrate-binding protein
LGVVLGLGVKAMRRRDFIAGFAGVAATWPLAVHAQQTERVRRIGVLLNASADDAAYQARLGAFLQGLQQAGWAIGRNIRIETRWAGANAADIRRHAEELGALSLDVVLASGSLAVRSMKQASPATAIVFVGLIDPVGAGFIESLARPGGNITGFLLFEYSLSGKWVDLLKEIAPGTTRVVVLRDPEISSGPAQFSVIQAVAPSLRIEATPVNVRDASGMERTVAAFARAGSGGLIVTGSGLATINRDRIVTLAARHKLPAIYSNRIFVTAGGLVSYGPDYVDMYRRVADDVDRILKGDKPADLPVQAPTKYELVINLKTAKALGLTVPPSLLARADEVIE